MKPDLPRCLMAAALLLIMPAFAYAQSPDTREALTGSSVHADTDSVPISGLTPSAVSAASIMFRDSAHTTMLAPARAEVNFEPTLAMREDDEWSRNRGSYIGAAVGASVGVLRAILQGDNLVGSAFFGALLGYTIGMVFNPT